MAITKALAGVVSQVTLYQPSCSAELNTILSTGKVLSVPQAPSVPVAVTFTAGGTPTEYTTPTGALTVANSAAPTAGELLKYCDELRGNVLQLQAILTAQGLTT